MSELLLQKNGILLKKYYDETLGKFNTQDITDISFRHLYDECTLENGVTLRDVFLLLQKNIEVYHAILGNWCDEIVNEGLSGGHDDLSDKANLDYLELCWNLTEDTDTNNIMGYHFPEFHGIGKDNDGEGDHQIPYAVDFTPTYKLIDLGLILNTRITIRPEFYNLQSPIYHFVGTFTLGQILYGIIWELSFCGSPTNRDIFKNEVEESAYKIMNMSKEELEQNCRELELPE